MWIFDLGLFVWVYFVSLLWQGVGFAYLRIFFHDLVDGGWATGRLISSLVVSVLVFSFASTGLPINTYTGLVACTLITVAFGHFLTQKKKFSLKVFFEEKWKYVLIEETLFLTGLIFMGTMRGFGPNIDNLEKFMDFGFVNQYLINAKLPVPDMWFAGHSINYYSFGHFWSSILIRSWRVAPATGFNLMVAYVFALGLVMGFSVTINLLKKVSFLKQFVGGLLSTSLLMLGGNSHILWYVVANKGLIEKELNSPYWYAMATRFIPFTIHEFPSYTFTIGDLHAHLLDLPTALLFLLIFSTWARSIKEKMSDLYLEILMGFVLGIMIMTNTWDAAIYTLLLIIYSLYRLSSRKTNRNIFLKGAGVIAGVAILTSCPWWWSFKQFSYGVGRVSTGSPLWQIAAIWFGQIVFGLLVWRLSKKNIGIRSTILLAFVLIIIPEFVYVKDIYDSYFRANTMFKLTYQAFVILSLLAGVALAKSLDRRHWIAVIGLMVISGALLLYPFTSYSNFYLNFKSYSGLNGERWMENAIEDRYGAIQYLQNNRDDKTLVEYPGRSFSLSNAASVFSGIPSVLGWRDHEWLWRGGLTEVKERTNEIKMIYEHPAGASTREIIDKYNVGWLILGNEERKFYDVDYWGLEQLGDKVWGDGKNFLLKIR